jgi:uncharacterized protein (DUF2164 family)
MAITLEKETKAYLLDSIKRFFLEEMEEDIGDLKAESVLDFFLREMGPSVYNQAMADAQAYFQDKVADLGDVRFEPEFEFWKRR